jgi:uncharacterized protein with HEPN domain
MRDEAGDPAHLWDMLDAARTLQQIVGGVSRDEYLRNRTVQLAVERLLEVIGEAARRVSEAFRQAHPEIPWRRIVAQRNVLSHQYGEIRQESLWEVVTVHIPPLISALEPLIPPLPPQEI